MRKDVKRELEGMGALGIGFGALVAFCGLLALAAPLAAGVMATYLVGGILVAAGITRIVWAFSALTLGRGVVRILFGGITLLAGIGIIATPLVGLVSLTLLLAIYFIADGVMEIIAARELRPEGGWGWLMFGGVVGLGLGVLIMAGFPLSGIWAVGALAGVHLLMTGMTMVMLGVGARQATRHVHA